MTTLTYCDNGHLWGWESGQRCGQCAAEANKQAMELIKEIENILDHRRVGGLREKVWLLRDILTD